MTFLSYSRNINLAAASSLIGGLLSAAYILHAILSPLPVASL